MLHQKPIRLIQAQQEYISFFVCVPKGIGVFVLCVYSCVCVCMCSYWPASGVFIQRWALVTLHLFIFNLHILPLLQTKWICINTKCITFLSHSHVLSLAQRHKQRHKHAQTSVIPFKGIPQLPLTALLKMCQGWEQTWVREMLFAAIYLLLPSFVVNIKPFDKDFLRVLVTQMHTF